MPTPPEQSDPLEPVLRDAEAELRRRLHEACEAEARGISTESSKEIRQLEDSLLAAAVAAEETIRLRRHIRKRADAAAGAEPASAADAAEEPISTLREFRDSNGTMWRAWSVTPGLARTGRSSERFLGDFHQGWVCFEATDSSGRRRLPCQPSRWVAARDEELEQMLRDAVSAPERRAEHRSRERDAEAPPRS